MLMGVRGFSRLPVLGVLCALAAAMLFWSAQALASGDANQASCSPETEASPGFRSYLPDCRAYEMITPPYTEGGIVLDEPEAISADGSRVIVGAGGVFSGGENYWFNPERNRDAATYEFVRGADGWLSSPLTPPAGEYSHSTLMAVSAETFETTLWGAEKTVAPGEPPALRFHEDIYLRSGPAASQFKLVGPGTPLGKNENIGSGSHELSLVGASRDLSHSFFEIESAPIPPDGHSDLWDGDTTNQGRLSLYEYVYTGTEDGEPVLVGVKNEGPLKGVDHVNEGAELISDCGTALGSRLINNPEEKTKGTVYNAVSSSGGVVFFTSFACAGGPEVNELYARVNGEHTVAVSEPVLPGGASGECASSEPCHGAAKQAGVFEGASEDGRRVFFLSEQPLVNGAVAEGMKLYEERLEGARVVQIIDVSNLGIAGVNPEVQGVVRVSEDGERVYFVAKGKLTGSDLVAGREHETEEPAQGADNLYVYEPDPAHPGAYRTVFVATLLTPAEEAALTTMEAEEGVEINARGEKLLTFESEPAQHEYERAEAEVLHKFETGEITIERALELLAAAEKRRVEAIEVAVAKERAFIEDTVGTLGPSGTLPEDQRVWQVEDSRPVQATPSGGVLVFPSSARLTPGDTSSVPQLFAFDAGDESLTRVSVGQAGPTSGNVDTFQDAPHIPGARFSGADLPTAAETGLVLSGDGSRIFFTSAASLAPGVENEATNVYEYSGGRVYLVSGGGDASKVNDSPTVTLLGTDASGQDAFFLSEAKLVPQYADTQVALYDAREDGGFPAPALEPGCLGETCRGASSVAPVSPSPGSADQAGGGNLPSLSPAPAASGVVGRKVTRAQLLAKALRSCRAKHARKQRTTCEARARARYGKSSVSRAHKATRAKEAKRGAGR
jgi:hypothetical protein